MILDSGTEKSVNQFTTFKVSEKIKPNTAYTIAIWADLAEGKEFEIKIGSGKDNHHLFINNEHAVKTGDGMYCMSAITNTEYVFSKYDTETIGILITPRDEEVLDFKIKKIKLEHGENHFPVWTPSPYDYLKDIETRLTALEKQIGGQ